MPRRALSLTSFGLDFSWLVSLGRCIGHGAAQRTSGRRAAYWGAHLGGTNGLVLPQPEVLVPFAASRFDEAGNLHDDQTKAAIRDLLGALGDWVRQLREGFGRAA